MMTTIEAPRTARVLTDAPPPKVNPSAPSHLAIVLNAGPERLVTLSAAHAALCAILSGCADSGVAILTLVRPHDLENLVSAALASARESTPAAQSIKLNVASPRDGRAELLDAVRRIAAQARTQTSRGQFVSEDISTATLENALSTRGLPPVDLLIATGGGSKLSGALLWQCAYAELLFVDSPWHAFTRPDITSALTDYARRCRKFGGLA